MANHVYFKGKGSWFRHLFQLDTMYAAPDDPGKWHLKLHPTQESLEEFKALKTKNRLMQDDDGYYINLNRPRKKTITLRTGGKKEIIFDPPKVFDKDGHPLSEDARIGNGSDVTAKCELYSYSYMGNRANAIRLESVRIDNLVPYEAKENYLPEEAKAAEGLMDQPEPLF